MKKNKTEVIEELENIAPFLSKIKKEKEAFDVPENYFKELPDQILSQIDFSKNNTFAKKSKFSFFQKRYNQLLERLAIFFQPKMAMGFSVAIILGCGIYFFSESSEFKLANTFTPLEILDKTISDAQLAEYIKLNIDDFEEELLFDFVNFDMDESELDESEIGEYLDEIIDQIDESDLDNFL